MTAEWWASEPEPIVAVLNLANLDDGGLIARTFCPEHADEIERLGEDLQKIDRLRTGGDDRNALIEHYGTNVIGGAYELARWCEEVADEKQADVLVRAALIASLVERRAVA